MRSPVVVCVTRKIGSISVLLCDLNHIIGFFDRHVGHKDPVNAGLVGLAVEPIDPPPVDHVVIREEHDRNVRIRPDFPDNFKDRIGRGAGGKRPFVRPLDGGTVCHRVRERHAEFEDVGAAIDERLCDPDQVSLSGSPATANPMNTVFPFSVNTDSMRPIMPPPVQSR